MDDLSHDGVMLIQEITTIFETHGLVTEIISASVRHPMHVVAVAKAGSHIATIPYSVIEQIIAHPLTTSGIEKFLKDWEGVEAG